MAKAEQTNSTEPSSQEGGNIIWTILSWLRRIDWFHILRSLIPSLASLPPPENARPADASSPASSSVSSSRNIFANTGSAAVGENIVGSVELNTDIDSSARAPRRSLPTAGVGDNLMSNEGSAAVFKSAGSLKVDTTVKADNDFSKSGIRDKRS